MPTDVIKTIANTSSPTTPDYSTLQAWEDAAPANLVTSDQRWIGECLDQGAFTGTLVIAGSTSDSTRYKWLRCASGAGFGDKANVRTTALNFSTSTGVAMNCNSNSAPLQMNESYCRVKGIQLDNTANTYGQAATITTDHALIEKCIIKGKYSTFFRILSSATNVCANCLLITTASGSGLDLMGEWRNCTVINTAGGGSTAFTNNYNSVKLVNCAIFGWSTPVNNTPASGTDYNATDASSFAGSGTHNQTSLTGSNEFTNTASDWRALSTGHLKAGTPDSTYAPDDITGLTRDATTPYIGAWEVASAATSPNSGILTGGALTLGRGHLFGGSKL